MIRHSYGSFWRILIPGGALNGHIKGAAIAIKADFDRQPAGLKEHIFGNGGAQHSSGIQNNGAAIGILYTHPAICGGIPGGHCPTLEVGVVMSVLPYADTGVAQGRAGCDGGAESVADLTGNDIAVFVRHAVHIGHAAGEDFNLVSAGDPVGHEHNAVVDRPGEDQILVGQNAVVTGFVQFLFPVDDVAVVVKDGTVHHPAGKRSAGIQVDASHTLVSQGVAICGVCVGLQPTGEGIGAAVGKVQGEVGAVVGTDDQIVRLSVAAGGAEGNNIHSYRAVCHAVGNDVNLGYTGTHSLDIGCFTVDGEDRYHRGVGRLGGDIGNACISVTIFQQVIDV